MMNDLEHPARKESTLEYFRLVDAGMPVFHLFAEDFQFYFPKFGIGRGVDEFMELAIGAQTSIGKIAHRIDNLLAPSDSNLVVAEGVTTGSDGQGKEWSGGETSGGRFCSVFSFNVDGLIDRMHVYLDPDYTGEHQEGFRWPNRKRQEW
jgi:SnoaL-like domain